MKYSRIRSIGHIKALEEPEFLSKFWAKNPARM
jgi:hypothetical protein